MAHKISSNRRMKPNLRLLIKISSNKTRKFLLKLMLKPRRMQRKRYPLSLSRRKLISHTRHRPLTKVANMTRGQPIPGLTSRIISYHRIKMNIRQSKSKPRLPHKTSINLLHRLQPKLLNSNVNIKIMKSKR